MGQLRVLDLEQDEVGATSNGHIKIAGEAKIRQERTAAGAAVGVRSINARCPPHTSHRSCADLPWRMTGQGCAADSACTEPC